VAVWLHWMPSGISAQKGSINYKIISMAEFIIELKHLQFFSFHGLFAEERKVGGEFIVDLSVKYVSNQKVITSLDETINYAALYDIVKKEMSEPRDLLETIAQTIADKIQKNFPLIKEIEIRIEKKNPPIVGISGNVAVKYLSQI
jgi:dihydroneopterin aldolase